MIVFMVFISYVSCEVVPIRGDLSLLCYKWLKDFLREY
jgi:hypothetical protein